MVYSGNPDQNLVQSGILSESLLPSPPLDPLQATTYLVAAERALRHLEYTLPQIDKMFSVFQIPRSGYGLYAGFDEGFIRAGLGFLEQIHIFIRSEVHDMPSLISGLGSLFAPFPAVLYTETSVHDIPVQAKYTNKGTDADATRPIAICLTSASESNSPKGLGSVPELNSQKSSNDNEWSTDRPGPPGDTNKSSEDKPSTNNLHKNGVGQGLEPEPSDGEENQARWKADITWDILSEICSSQPGEPRQCLGMKGKVMIKRTAELVESEKFATCKVEFTDLRFRIGQLTDKLHYGHFYTTVNINSLQKNADIPYFEPKRTLQFARASKVVSASKTGSSNTTPSTAAAAFARLPTFGTTIGANTAQTKESSTGTEQTTNNTRIEQMDMNGAIRWGFNFADPCETKGGMRLNIDELPCVDFTFVGDADTPASLPQTMKIEVRIYWSSLPATGVTGQTSQQNLGNKPFYSNLCQMTILNVPPNLQKNYCYQATLSVSPQQKASMAMRLENCPGKVYYHPKNNNWKKDRWISHELMRPKTM